MLAPTCLSFIHGTVLCGPQKKPVFPRQRLPAPNTPLNVSTGLTTGEGRGEEEREREKKRERVIARTSIAPLLSEN